MRCLTLWQPWATLVALGLKKLETRPNGFGYRGLVAIHSSKVSPKWARELLLQEPFASALKDCPTLPCGVVLAVSELVDDITIPEWRGRPERVRDGGVWFPPDEPERSFGDFTPGRHALVLSNTRASPTPIPARGMQGLWNWTPPDGFSL